MEVWNCHLAGAQLPLLSRTATKQLHHPPRPLSTIAPATKPTQHTIPIIKSHCMAYHSQSCTPSLAAQHHYIPPARGPPHPSLGPWAAGVHAWHGMRGLTHCGPCGVCFCCCSQCMRPCMAIMATAHLKLEEAITSSATHPHARLHEHQVAGHEHRMVPDTKADYRCSLVGSQILIRYLAGLHGARLRWLLDLCLSVCLPL
jgi:hypothetical protein